MGLPTGSQGTSYRKLAGGSMFSDREVRGAAKVGFIGSKTATELFGPLDPVGRAVRVQNSTGGRELARITDKKATDVVPESNLDLRNCLDKVLRQADT
jgi:hypothetical protein